MEGGGGLSFSLICPISCTIVIPLIPLIINKRNTYPIKGLTK